MFLKKNNYNKTKGTYKRRKTLRNKTVNVYFNYKAKLKH